MVRFLPKNVMYKHDYPAIFAKIAAGELPARGTYRQLCRTDLFFLLHFGLAREDVNHPFVVGCIREVEVNHNNTLDLWAREHYKSTILTYGLPIQELLLDPEERICIFSHTRPIAKGFLRQIKLTLESDVPVVQWFPDIFWSRPKSQAPKWSEDDGLIIRRKSNPKESSIEAWGLVDGQPTSKHFTTRVYDDIVTRESVTTPEQLKKNMDAYQLSHSLGTDAGQKRVVGTHYHFADTYTRLKKMPGYTVRIKPATKDGKPTGDPVFLSKGRLAELLAEQGSYIFSCQQLLNPIASSEQKFDIDDLRFYDARPSRLNKYLLVDPANAKKRSSDYTVMCVVGIDGNQNRFLLDLLRDRLSLSERWTALKTMYAQNPGILSVGYEQYGMQADIPYIQERQGQEGLYFEIIPIGGQVSKWDRIYRLTPKFENGKFWLPHRLAYKTVQGGKVDMIRIFIDEEYTTAPYCAHDDMLDCISRIEDPALGATAPMAMTQRRNTHAKTTDVMKRLRGRA